MLRIGLTGGIGSGKSTVAHGFAMHGVPVIDSDQLAREVVNPGQPALQRLVEALGDWILDKQGCLDRGAVRERAFRDPELLGQIEAILHPAIAAEMKRQLVGLNSPYCIIVIPLLLERGWQHHVDRILVVDLPREQQLRRAMLRDNSDQAGIERIMTTQYSRAQRLEVADDVIDNSQETAALTPQIEQLHLKYLELASKP